MTDLATRPLDAAVARTLSEISTWAAEELAARIERKARSARVGFSGQSASRYVDSEDCCVRISDHEAMSYNRTGDFNISIAPARFVDAHAWVSIDEVYEVTEMEPSEFDEDGEILAFTSCGSREAGKDEGDAEFVGYRVDFDQLVAAIAAAERFVIAHHA